MPENTVSTSQPPSHSSDWATREQSDWTSTQGNEELRKIITACVPYRPADFQIQNTARLLQGQDVLCVSATGDGKSALLYMYPMARPDTITMVVSPTNALEGDMVCGTTTLLTVS